MKKAFTLSEMLVCFAIIAALLAIFLSTIRVKPNTNMVMFRKAYNTTTSVVSEMLQSAMYYESGSLSAKDATSETINGEKPSENTKFCKVFAHFINTIEQPDCTAGAGVSFTTPDGIDWYMPPKTTNGSFTANETIRVDVNGVDNIPNCADGAEGCDVPDIFEFTVEESGKIFINGDIAKQYLQNTRNISK